MILRGPFSFSGVVVWQRARRRGTEQLETRDGTALPGLSEADAACCGGTGAGYARWERWAEGGGVVMGERCCWERR